MKGLYVVILVPLTSADIHTLCASAISIGRLRPSRAISTKVSIYLPFQFLILNDCSIKDMHHRRPCLALHDLDLIVQIFKEDEDDLD